MKIGSKLQELRSALEHSPGLLLIHEKASLQTFREEWDFIVRKRIPVLPAATVQSLMPAEELSRLEVEMPAREIVHFRNINVWPAVGLVSTRNGTLITESAYNAERLQALLRTKPFNRYPVIKSDDIPCTIIEAGSRPGDYANWIIDTLPRIWPLHRPEVQVLGPINLYIGQGLPKQKEELLRALLPPTVQVQRIPERSRIEAYQFVMLPFFSVEGFGYLPPDYVDFFKNRVFNHFGISASAPKHRRLLISRARAAKRRIVNEEVLSRELASHGFETVLLEDLPHAAQAALFNEAEVVVGVHGAGFSNLIYASHCRVVEVFPSQPVWTYRGLATSCGLPYASIAGDSYDRDANLVVRTEDILERLEKLG